MPGDPYFPLNKPSVTYEGTSVTIGPVVEPAPTPDIALSMRDRGLTGIEEEARLIELILDTELDAIDKAGQKGAEPWMTLFKECGELKQVIHQLRVDAHFEIRRLWLAWRSGPYAWMRFYKKRPPTLQPARDKIKERAKIFNAVWRWFDKIPSPADVPTAPGITSETASGDGSEESDEPDEDKPKPQPQPKPNAPPGKLAITVVDIPRMNPPGIRPPGLKPPGLGKPPGPGPRPIKGKTAPGPGPAPGPSPKPRPSPAPIGGGGGGPTGGGGGGGGGGGSGVGDGRPDVWRPSSGGSAGGTTGSSTTDKADSSSLAPIVIYVWDGTKFVAVVKEAPPKKDGDKGSRGDEPGADQGGEDSGAPDPFGFHRSTDWLRPGDPDPDRASTELDESDEVYLESVLERIGLPPLNLRRSYFQEAAKVYLAFRDPDPLPFGAAARDAIMASMLSSMRGSGVISLAGGPNPRDESEFMGLDRRFTQLPETAVVEEEGGDEGDRAERGTPGWIRKEPMIDPRRTIGSPTIATATSIARTGRLL